MPIQLDKILADIASEKVLHPNYPGATKKEMDDAWMRVGKNNNLSVHESRSIFKVLQKKYEQEKLKESSAWKLFSIMEQIHKKVEIKQEKSAEEDTGVPLEEDEEYEMLEVQEEEDHSGLSLQQASSTGSASDGESPTKSVKSNNSPEKENPAQRECRTQTAASNVAYHSTTNATPAAPPEEKKLLNTMASGTPRSAAHAANAQTSAAALQKKGITLKKTPANTPLGGMGKGVAVSGVNAKSSIVRCSSVTTSGGGHVFEVGKTIQLPESLKRKLSEEQSVVPQIKKLHNPQQQSSASSNTSPAAKVPLSSPQVATHTTTTQLMQLKHERNDHSTVAQESSSTVSCMPPHGINLITIPANPTRSDLTNGLVTTTGGASSTAATVASTSTNGFSPRIEDIDFRNDIIFDAGNGVNGATIHATSKVNTNSEVINLGNFDNSLPPTFFKNLCNSSRHEALGLYVANVMNRLRPRSAAKLELGILRAIIDIQSEEFEQ